MSRLAPAVDLARINEELGHDAAGLVRWAVGLGLSNIVTTNFRPFEAVILHLLTQSANINNNARIFSANSLQLRNEDQCASQHQ